MKQQLKIGDIKIPYLNKFLKKRGFIQEKIISSWSNLVGEFENFTSPNRIKFPKNKFDEGTLFIKVKSGIGPEIDMRSKDIINKINSMFGYKAINKIKILNGDFEVEYESKNKLIQKKEIDIKQLKKIREIKNDNLANTLISIGNYIKKWDTRLSIRKD